MRLVVGLTVFWINGGHIRDGAAWSERAVQVAGSLPLALQAEALDSAAMFARRSLDLERAEALAEEAFAAFRATEDADGEAWSLRHLGVIAGLRGDLERAVSLTAEAASRYEKLGDRRGLQVVIDDQACWALDLGDFARARSLFDESLERARELITTRTSDPRFSAWASWRSPSTAMRRRGRSSRRVSSVSFAPGDGWTSRSHFAASQPLRSDVAIL